MADTDQPNRPFPADPTSSAAGGTATVDPPADVRPAGAPPAVGYQSGIDRLTKMSTTAGLGSGDYAAVNTLAVVALAAAVIGGLASLLSGILLAIPAVALVVAVVALRQIRNSNGTQAGTTLAGLAIVLSVAALGYVIGGWVVNDLRTRPDRQQILAAVEEFDRAIAKNDLGAAYQLTTSGFRRRVPEARWRQTFAQFEAIPEFGGVAGVAWNGVPIIFEVNPENDVRTAGINVLFKYRKGTEPGRVPFGFTQEDGKWLINDMPSLFQKAPTKQATQG